MALWEASLWAKVFRRSVAESARLPQERDTSLSASAPVVPPELQSPGHKGVRRLASNLLGFEHLGLPVKDFAVRAVDGGEHHRSQNQEAQCKRNHR